jgi:hypothetical protein
VVAAWQHCVGVVDEPWCGGSEVSLASTHSLGDMALPRRSLCARWCACCGRRMQPDVDDGGDVAVVTR